MSDSARMCLGIEFRAAFKLDTYGGRGHVLSAVLLQPFGAASRNISRDSPLSLAVFRRYLKTFLFARY